VRDHALVSICQHPGNSSRIPDIDAATRRIYGGGSRQQQVQLLSGLAYVYDRYTRDIYLPCIPSREPARDHVIPEAAL
jgi:hypothetical protein